ncbi:sugar transferase [Streptomyces sp. NBC_01443]|uniref:sugar transferase n=1 Tax=Streptomyces sp. NBC_01443 TaxID=2903868 RepID=UPI0022533C10|nr:sugar transferase [Streptomyces sp. NBC_01443]MCX4628602.1 sugar transferase [Streptomyces sp. NBC_01443]WSW44621.1 sugar transferase [Streptomyces sp. NBC_01001]
MPLPPLTLPPIRRLVRRRPATPRPSPSPSPSPPPSLLSLPYRPDLSAKRVADLLGAMVLLGVFAAPLLLAAALLYAAQGGRAFVREPAAGLAGRPFRTWRLRTDAAGRLGAAVERCALDGIPQVLNVLRGEMSLVGPRAEPRTDRADRLLVRPGMTGLWQVSARSDLPWEEMALLDRHYVESHWLGMDLAILAQTPRAAYRQRCRQRHA